MASLDTEVPVTSVDDTDLQAPPPPSFSSPNGSDGTESAPSIASTTVDTTDDKKKKKKKKVKKLEPWRSGNLESWINKWQAAQKELDG